MNAELVNATKQAYEKVGRNVEIFHKLEAMLKRLTAASDISGYVSEMEQKAQKQIESLSKQTLGQVAGLYIEKNSAGDDDIDLGPDDPKEPWISFGHKISGEGTEERKKIFSSLIEERNKLIHQFDQVCDLTSLESCKQAENYLDHQYDSVIAELRILDYQEQARNILTRAMILPATKDIANSFALLSYLQQRPSIMMLGKLSLQLKREDGWTILDEALSHLNLEASAEIKELKKQCHCKTHKELMLKADVFEFLEETTKKGGSRLLYRVKPDCSVWVTDNVTILTLQIHPQNIVPRF